MAGTSNLHFYLNRFLVIFWFLLLPCLFFMMFLLLRELSRRQQRTVVFARFRLLERYGYAYHNFLFLFVLGSLVFNLAFFLYCLSDLYLLGGSYSYYTIWHISSASAKDTTNQANFFFLIVSLGQLFHLIWGLLYLHYNLYSVDSYFAYRWRRYVISNVQGNPRWRSFRTKYPRLYGLLYSRFLAPSNFNKIQQDKGVILIDY